MRALVAQASGDPLVRWDWVLDHLGDIRVQLLEHLYLTGLAVGVGFLISMVLAVIALRYRPAYAVITGVAGILYTIPSIALFTLLIPFVGLSVLNAEIALVSYTLLILVRNIVVGVEGVPEAVRESARAMGYRPWRAFLEIDLPLALPVILAGLRIATVTIVGLVTVSALIGLGGLGAFILDGLRRLFATPILVGTLLSVALAVAFDLVFVGAERLLTPWARTRT
ncbi:MAG: ABC transporter permease [Acidimicrobiia bacterium]